MPQDSKIVIADDNVEICELVREILRGNGYDVDQVHNGYELLAYLEKNTPKIIILDLMMPEKDGLSIISSIKEISPYSRIIIYTGYHEFEKSVYARSVDRFLVKGATIDKLIDVVEELSR
jgi:DNA-binding response OmpR family regulator